MQTEVAQNVQPLSSEARCKIYICHTAKDNIDALALRSWLLDNGWAADDVFLDIHDIAAGDQWQEKSRKANAACEVFVMLASPEFNGF